jgi:hypothetical protein
MRVASFLAEVMTMKRPTRAKREKEILARGRVPEMRERYAEIAGDARKVLLRRVRPLEKRAEAMTVEARRLAAGYIREAVRMLTRLEKTLAPRRARKPRAKAKKAAPAHAAPVEVPRMRAASSEAAA